MSRPPRLVVGVRFDPSSMPFWRGIYLVWGIRGGLTLHDVIYINSDPDCQLIS